MDVTDPRPLAGQHAGPFAQGRQICSRDRSPLAFSGQQLSLATEGHDVQFVASVGSPPPSDSQGCEGQGGEVAHEVTADLLEDVSHVIVQSWEHVVAPSGVGLSAV